MSVAQTFFYLLCDQVTSLISWANSDVLRWLRKRRLDVFTERFKAARVTGHDLANIDMDFFERTQVQSVQEKEMLLSHLYKLKESMTPRSTNLGTTMSPNSTAASQQSVISSHQNSDLTSSGRFQREEIGQQDMWTLMHRKKANKSVTIIFTLCYIRSL